MVLEICLKTAPDIPISVSKKSFCFLNKLVRRSYYPSTTFESTDSIFINPCIHVFILYPADLLFGHSYARKWNVLLHICCTLSFLKTRFNPLTGWSCNVVWFLMTTLHSVQVNSNTLAVFIYVQTQVRRRFHFFIVSIFLNRMSPPFFPLTLSTCSNF